jgi:dTDP-4-amino-4,6-dideoxygalactose transaminase
VIEDACQGHLSVYKGKKLGTIGDLGCFSFQSSKTIACGEGGAVIGNDEVLMEQCYTVHNHGTSRHGITEVIGPKYRMNELEAALLLGQLAGVEERFRRRNENAAHLTWRLKDFPGVRPQKLYEGTESGSFYIYAMTYKKEHFNDTDRDTFLKAVAAEGVNLDGYKRTGLHTEPWVDHIANSRVYKKMYSARRLEQYLDERSCPVCDQVCQEMAMVWATGPLLGTKADMDDIVDAILKVYENRDQLSRIG